MKLFKDNNNSVYAYAADGSQDEFIKAGLVEITQDEADILRFPADPLPNVKVRLVKAVDDSIAAIYSKFTRFSDEYKLREEEAMAFIASGYTGSVGDLVHGYAVTIPDMTDQQAAEIIIAQANALRSALKVLGNLRMRKNEIKSDSVVNVVAAQAIHDEIVALANLAVKDL